MDMAENSVASNPTSSGDGGRGGGRDLPTQDCMYNTMDQRRTSRKENTTIVPSNSGKSGLRGRAPSGDDDCEGEQEQQERQEEDEPVIQSAVMLRFGAEAPPLVAAGKCGRTAQFPIPDDWNDPEVST